MRRSSLLIASTMLVACSAAPAPAPTPMAPPSRPPAVASTQSKPDPDSPAKAVLHELADKQYQKVVDRFDEALSKALPTKALGEVWEEWTEGLGKYDHAEVVAREARPDGGESVHVDAIHAGGVVTFVIGFDRDQKVSSFRRPPRPERAAYETAAKTFVDRFMASDWTGVVSVLDPIMKAAFPAQKAKAVRDEVVADTGALREVTAIRVAPRPFGAIVDVECAFEKKPLVLRVPMDRRLRAVGFFLRPAWAPPDYADRSTFEERSVTVGLERLPLPAVLTMPKGKGPFPAVVLVHGSGPNDRDETLGPNKLFKDLAWGLASRGVAVLRYDKRTFHHSGKLQPDDTKTVQEESIDDTRAAIDLLSRTPGIDPKRVSVVGHSLGAMIAPRIAQGDPRVHGIVLLAGPTRSEGQIHIDQHQYLFGLQKLPPTELERRMLTVRQVASRLDSPDLKPDEMVEGVPGRYWIDLREHQGKDIAPKLTLPILVLQGVRDYQVTMVDFDGWKAALSKKRNATLKTYPDLNHHFMPGKGQSTPKEYEEPNHVPLQVIDDLAKWIRTGRPSLRSE